MIRLKIISLESLLAPQPRKTISANLSYLDMKKTNRQDRKFKIVINDIKWVSVNLISAEARIKLATAIEKGESVKLKTRTIREYDKIKEITILDLVGNENGRWKFKVARLEKEIKELKK